MLKTDHSIHCMCRNKKLNCYIASNSDIFVWACFINNKTEIHLKKQQYSISKYIEANSLSEEYIEKLLLLI
jgi:hypothetical protein